VCQTLQVSSKCTTTVNFTLWKLFPSIFFEVFAGKHFFNILRTHRVPEIESLNSNPGRYHSAIYERAIPGYAGHPNKFTNRMVSSDNRYGPSYTDMTPVHSTMAYKVNFI
jgi:hypothetical protein